MAEVKWCQECGRMIGIGCACGLTFKEKMDSVAFSFEGWAPSNQPVDVPDSYKKRYPNSKLSTKRPPPLK
jgi:hypothetical protein